MINWGIIGAGDVCEKKSGPAFQKIDGSALIAIMRRTPEKAKDFAFRHNVEKWYTSAQELVDDPYVNAIYIATPPGNRLEYLKMAAKAGKPIYMEKPMAVSYDQCKEMISICKAVNVPLFIAYYRRALPNFLKVKELLEKGAIGKVQFVDIKLLKAKSKYVISLDKNDWRTTPEISGGGYFFDLASHQLDFFDFLFGEITQVSGVSTNFGNHYVADDTTVANFVFSNGVVGSGTWAFATSENSEQERTTIYGSLGKISFEFFGKPDIRIEIDNHETETIVFPYPENIQICLIQTVVDELLGNGKCPSTAISAARTQLVMEKITSRKS